MNISKKLLKSLIENYLFEDEKNTNLKNSQSYTSGAGMTGENILTKDVKFQWGAYKGKHANEKYVILQGETELGDIQKKGDPFTYRKLNDGRLKVISGPAKFDGSMGKIAGKKKSSQSSSNKSSPAPAINQTSIEDFLTFKDIATLQKLIKTRDSVVNMLKNFKGTIQLKNEKSGQKETVTFSKDDLGVVKNAPPRLLVSEWYKSLEGSNIKKYNDTLEEIMKITYEMHIEMLNNLSDYLDMGQDANLFATSSNTKKYINLANDYVKKYYSLIYKICNDIPVNINPYWKYAIEKNKSSANLLKKGMFSALINTVLKLLNAISKETDKTKRTKMINNLLPYLNDSKIS